MENPAPGNPVRRTGGPFPRGDPGIEAPRRGGAPVTLGTGRGTGEGREKPDLSGKGTLTMEKRMRRLALPLLLLLLLTGCPSIGPGTIDRDRFDYTTAIAESWKSQMLLNIVRLRYGDTPVFIDVPSVINQYSLQGRIALGGDWQPNEISDGSMEFGTEGIYSERPTITYVPLSGEKFTRSLLTPISPASLLFLIQSGWPVNVLLEMCVKSVNDIENISSASGFSRDRDPEFQRLADLLTKIQRAGAVGTRILRRKKWDVAMITFRRKVDPEIAADIQEARSLLGLAPDAEEIKVTYGTAPVEANEIALLTRSIMDILIEISAQMEVPPEHAAEGRTYATPPEVGQGEGQIHPFCRIVSGTRKPSDAFAAVKNRDHWYWIDDCDRLSKGRFTFLMILFSLAETGGAAQAPLITVPIN